MKNFLSTYRVFILLILAFVTSVIITRSQISKEQLHLFANQFYSPFFDEFFKSASKIGNGAIFVPVLLIGMLFLSTRNIILGFFTGIYTLILVPIFKNAVPLVLSKEDFFYRPKRYFAEFSEHTLRFVEGYENHSIRSFPSGHTTTAFALCLFLLTISKVNKAKQMFFFFLALLIAYSRVYLSEHFFQDLALGSLLGTLCFYLAKITTEKLSPTEQKFLTFAKTGFRKQV